MTSPYLRYLRTSLHREDPRCRYCGRTLTRKRATVDHVLPTSRGGESTPENLTLACRDCNACKGDRTPLEWLADLLAAVRKIGGVA